MLVNFHIRQSVVQSAANAKFFARKIVFAPVHAFCIPLANLKIGLAILKKTYRPIKLITLQKTHKDVCIFAGFSLSWFFE